MTPLDMPTYNPTVDTGDDRHDRHDRQDRRADRHDRSARMRSARGRSERSHRRDRRVRFRDGDVRERRTINQRHAFKQPSAQYPQPYTTTRVPDVVEQKTEKTQRALRFLSEYGGRLFVFILVLVVLFLYQKMAAVPYIGNGQKVTFVGSVFLASAVSGAWGVGSAFF